MTTPHGPDPGEGETAWLMRVVPHVHAITERIAVTNVVSANDPAILQREGFSPADILCLDPASQARHGADGRMLVPLIDGKNADGAFARAVDALDRLLETRERVLVHCHAGRSRSLAVVAAHLVRHHGMSPDTALAHVRARRPCDRIMPGLLKDLRRQRPA